MTKKALILVDIQNDFMPEGGLAVPEGNEIIEPANDMIKFAKSQDWLIVATQDWHPANHGSFASNNDAEPFSMGELDGLEQVMWTDHCVEESVGAMFHPLLLVEYIDEIVRKGTNPLVDSYSGFFDNAKRGDTGLHDILQREGVEEVYILGLARDYCVAFTAQDAVSLGYKTNLVVDATRAVNFPNGSDGDAIIAMLKAGITFINSYIITNFAKKLKE